MRWSLFRVPLLTSGEEHPAAASFARSFASGNVDFAIQYARQMLEEIAEDQWIGKPPILSS
jgi:hypothetical protein